MENMMTQNDQSGQNAKEVCHTHRVGSITCGIMLVLYGILFLIHMIQPSLNYNIIFELWPLILIFLGVEILAGSTSKNQEKNKFVYDFAAVLLIFIVAFFAMVMSAVSYYNEYYYRVYNSEEVMENGTYNHGIVTESGTYAPGIVIESGNITLD